jgi:hypothetical protein
MRLPTTPLLALTLLSTTLIACGDDAPDPATVRARLRDDLGRILREGQAATAATANLPSGSALSFATSALGGSEGIVARAVTPMSRILAPNPRGVLAFDEEDGGSDTDALVQMLEQQLFTDANHLGDGVYQVPPSLVCQTTIYDPTTGLPTTGIDPDCAQQLSQLQLRIRVASADSALRFYIQVSKNRDEPLSFLLANNELAVTLNLDEAEDAMRALAPVFGEQAPNVELAGQITGSLKILGAAHARVSLTFDRALSVKVAEQGKSLAGPDALRFASAAGEIIGLALDANTPSLAFDLGLGETTAHVPDDLGPGKDISLGGATMNAVLQGTITNLSLGNKATTVMVGNQQAMKLELNPDHGRKLDLTISHDAIDGSETLAVTPRLELRHAVDHALLGEEAPVYDITHVLVEGTLRSEPFGDRIRVVTGNASILTNPAGYGFSASAGQCIDATEIYDDQSYTSYTRYTVTSCQ